MQKTYVLNGMSCDGCVENVKRVLLQLPDIEEAKVQLHPPEAILTMKTSIDVSQLQAQLHKAGHYTIQEVTSNP